jgi:hypothetical protein
MNVEVINPIEYKLVDVTSVDIGAGTIWMPA